MILAVPLPPTPGQVILGVLAAFAGALIATVSAFLARRSRNWLHYLDTAGGLAIVAGIIGQRTVAGGAAVGLWLGGRFRLFPHQYGHLALRLVCF